MTKKKKVIIGVIVLLLIVMVIFVFAKKNKEVGEYITEKVIQTNLRQTVSVTGELVASDELNLNFETVGRVNAVSVVGKKVAEGDILGQIDDLALNKQVEIARLALEKARAELGINNDVIVEADQAVSNAKHYLEEVEDLENQKVEAADRAYADASNYYDTASDYYDKITEDEGSTSTANALSAKLTLDTAEKNKNAAEDAKETARKTRNVNVQSAENSYKLAKDQRTTAQSTFAKSTKDIAIQTAQANYDIALNNLQKAALVSPVNGMVTQINYEVGEILGSATLTEPFAKVLSYDFIIKSNVPESDIADIVLGQKAQIAFDALSDDETFTAEVIEIEPASTVIQDVVYYKIKLKLDNIDQRLKAGMSCDIDLEISEKKNALAVPQRAVERNDDGKTQVKILKADGQAEEISVKTGLKDDEGLIEIVSGLKEGDEVVVSEGK